MIRYFQDCNFYKYIFLCIALTMLVLIPFKMQAFQKEIPDYYPMNYDGKGVVDRKGDTDIVIGDIEYKLAVNVDYHTPWSRVSSGYSVKKGSYVGFILKKKGEIISIWLINDYVDTRK